LLQYLFIVLFAEKFLDRLPVDVVVLVYDSVQQLRVVVFLNAESLFHELRVKAVLLGHVGQFLLGFGVDGLGVDRLAFG
jgi:hypothetical protein